MEKLFHFSVLVIFFKLMFLVTYVRNEETRNRKDIQKDMMSLLRIRRNTDKYPNAVAKPVIHKKFSIKPNGRRWTFNDSDCSYQTCAIKCHSKDKKSCLMRCSCRKPKPATKGKVSKGCEVHEERICERVCIRSRCKRICHMRLVKQCAVE